MIFFWEQHIKSKGADFVYFVDASVLPADSADGYSCVVLFGRALSKEYINALRAGEKPKTKEVINTERKMDTLAVKLASELGAEGYSSVAKLKFGQLPHLCLKCMLWCPYTEKYAKCTYS